MRNWLAIFGWYALASLATFAVFALDKWQAQRDSRRVPEKLLHLLEALGGWPGALIASRSLHHKSRKKHFRLVLWLIVALHLLVWIAYFLLGRADQ